MLKIKILGVPLDLGQERRGVDMGPSAVRAAGLNHALKSLGHHVEDAGNIHVRLPEEQHFGDRHAKYLKEIAETSQEIAHRIYEALEGGYFPVSLGGDHSVAIGTIAGVASHLRRTKKRLGVLWVDAHPDMNTPETSSSGNVHGMPLACSIGLGPRKLTHLCGFAPKVDPANVALVGIRDVDALEKPHVRNSGVRAFTMRDIDERGMRAVMAEALEIVCAGTAGFHVSLDLDSVDPEFAPGVGTPVRGGLNYREAHLAMEMAGDTRRLLSMEVVEVNPIIDEANRTALLAVELVLSAMGKRIL